MLNIPNLFNSNRPPVQFKFFHRTLIFVCWFLLSTINVLGQTTRQNPELKDKWSAWWEMGGTMESFGELDADISLFAPRLQSSRSLLFVDWRGRIFDATEANYNLAIGLRHMLQGEWNFGGLIGIASTESELGAEFYEALAGIELLHPNWDIRINGYLPVDMKQIGPDPYKVFIGNSEIYMAQIDEFALKGGEFEIGWRIPTEIFDPAWDESKTDLRVYGGGHVFNHADIDDPVYGFKARTEVRFKDFLPDLLPGADLTVSAEFLKDNLREKQKELSLRVRIPLNESGTGYMESKSLSRQEQRMIEAVQRKEKSYISSKTHSRESVEDVFTDVSFDRVVRADDYESLANAIALGPNTLIILEGGKGSIDFAPGSSLTLGTRQTLVGSGGSFSVRGQESGQEQLFRIPGSQPKLIMKLDSLIGTSSRTHISNLHISGSTDSRFTTGIYGQYVSYVYIRNNIFSGLSTGVYTFASNNIFISDNLFEYTSTSVIGDYLSNFTISNNYFLDTSFIAIILLETLDGFITGNKINGVANTGIRIARGSHNIEVSNNDIEDVLKGIHVGDIGFFGGNFDIYLRDNSISNAAESAIKSEQDSQLFMINNVIHGTGMFGIDLSMAGDMELDGNIFSGIFLNSFINLNEAHNIKGHNIVGQTQTIAEYCTVNPASSDIEIHFSNGVMCSQP
ncbi:MAG: right-handed parallel beta-helix repeat-containing protein [Methyloligellaceae bacterium]